LIDGAAAAAAETNFFPKKIHEEKVKFPLKKHNFCLEGKIHIPKVSDRVMDSIHHRK
jgi:hypothetical protein